MTIRVNIALPVLNEEVVLEDAVRQVVDACAFSLPEEEVTVIISDNGSEDRTAEIGKRLAAEISGVRYLRVGETGKGIAIRGAWQSEEADVYVFMDIDLSTDLGALPDLVRTARECGGMAIGSRFHRESKVTRSFVRRLVSFGYRWYLRAVLRTKVNDAPCGFKAATDEVVFNIMPFVRDERWFFDTELVIRAERGGYEIREMPIVWSERAVAGRESKVNVLKLSLEYARKVMDLKKRLK
ncbi:MAG: glycosyltransferase [Patescibacteria group bacterium]|nr:glycosyltransferase [Patescibacteria group bacterium]